MTPTLNGIQYKQGKKGRIQLRRKGRAEETAGKSGGTQEHKKREEKDAPLRELKGLPRGNGVQSGKKKMGRGASYGCAVFVARRRKSVVGRGTEYGKQNVKDVKI